MNMFKMIWSISHEEKEKDQSHDNKDAFNDDEEQRGMHVQANDLCLGVIQKCRRNQRKKNHSEKSKI